MSNSAQPYGLVACQAPLSMGFSRQECQRGLPCPSPGNLPNPWTEPSSPASQADSLPAEPLGKPLLRVRHVLYIRYKGEGECHSSKAQSVIGWGLEH